MPNSSNGRTKPGTAVDIVSTLRRAMAAHQNGQLDDAEILYRTVLDNDARQFDALQMLGILEAQRGKFEDGRTLIARALKANPQSAEAHCNLGRVLKELGRREEALASFDKALAINPMLTIGLSNRGVLLRELGRAEEALASYDRALALAPNNIDIMFNRGNVLRDMRRSAEALAVFDAVLGYHAGYVDARIARANVLHDTQRYQEALEELERVLVDQPKNVIALSNRGNELLALGRDDEALDAYNAAVAAEPNYAQSYQNRGNLMMLRGLHRNAAADFATALHLDGNCKYALGNFVHCRMSSCDWAGLDEARASLREDVLAGRPVAVPLVMLGASNSPQEQYLCARTYVADRYPAVSSVPTFGRHAHDRIRIAYVSADLREHPVTLLAAGLFEQHDRSRFETTAISLSSEQPSAMLDRLKAGVERFVTVAGKSNAEIVAMMRDLEIDIAIDLMGHTQNARTGIFAARAAPIQVNYLGFAGTSGADYIDYIVADRFVVPQDQEHFYSEKVVCLPDTYMVNDSRRRTSATQWSRAEAGLPEQGIVFCVFNAIHKCKPAIFAVWMRLLEKCPGSVLWLSETSEAARASLSREAGALGVEPGRLIFAPRLEQNAHHLARSRLADIFLDTPDYNAHATAADALWVGVPVVTLAGQTFCSRVAGSLLNAIGAPELITHSLADYESLALALARDPDRLAQMKKKLASNRLTSPLFDTKRFARHLEAAYTTMWQRFERGEQPSSLAIDPMP